MKQINFLKNIYVSAFELIRCLSFNSEMCFPKANCLDFPPKPSYIFLSGTCTHPSLSLTPPVYIYFCSLFSSSILAITTRVSLSIYFYFYCVLFSHSWCFFPTISESYSGNSLTFFFF